MHGTYNLPLVLLSLVIATLASYTALDLAAFISLLEKRTLRRAWLAGGAVAMGTGIWSMHFVGMLALSLPIPLGYALTDTGASLAIAVLVSYFALTVVTRARLGGARLLAGGMLMGAGIVGMHYTGMAAMRMTPGIRYDPAVRGVDRRGGDRVDGRAVDGAGVARSTRAMRARCGSARRSSWASRSPACTTRRWRPRILRRTRAAAPRTGSMRRGSRRPSRCSPPRP
jgi:hypothetical protein